MPNSKEAAQTVSQKHLAHRLLANSVKARQKQAEQFSTLYLEELGARTLLEINISYKAKQNFVFHYKTNLKLKAIARNT